MTFANRCAAGSRSFRLVCSLAAVALLHASAQPALAEMVGESTRVRGATLSGGGAVGTRSEEAGSALGDVGGTIGADPGMVFRRGDGSPVVAPGPWPVVASEAGGGSDATATPVPTASAAVATATPSRTVTGGGAATATTTPVAGPTNTPPGEPAVPDFFPRGDADCNVRLSAADVVSSLLGTAENGCDNADCDRDGVVTEADALCEAKCLFGDCPLLPGAPQIGSVVPETAEDVVALSLVRIRGSDLSSNDGPLQVRIGGQAAGIVESSPEEIVVAVPPMDPGPVDLVVIDGEKASRRLALTIAEPPATADADGLADLLDVFDEAAGRFAALDLTAVYDEESAALLAELTAASREEVERFRRDGLDPLDPDIRAVLDRLVSGGGAVGALRERLRELDGTEGAGGGAGPGVTVEVTKRVVTQIYVATAELTNLYSTAKVELLGEIAAAAQTAEKLRTLLSAAAGALRVSVALLGWTAVIDIAPQALADATVPIPLGFVFHDRDGKERDYPTAGGTMRMRGCRVGASATRLDLRMPGVETSVPLAPMGSCADTDGLDACPPRPIPPLENGCVEVRFPDTVGFCGQVGLRVSNEIVGVRFEFGEVGLEVQPEILAARVVRPGVADGIELDVRGVAPCATFEVYLEGPDPSTARRRVGEPRTTLEGSDPQRIATSPETKSGIEERCTYVFVPPGRHAPRVGVDGVLSEEEFLLDLPNLTKHVAVSCRDPILSLSGEEHPRFTTCDFRPQRVLGNGQRSTQGCFPLEVEEVVPTILATDILVPKIGSEVVRASGEPALRLDENRRESFELRVEAVQPGTAIVDGAVFLEGGFFLAETDESFELEVRDRFEPVLTVDPCGGTIGAGELLEIDVDVLDDFLVNKLVVTAPESVTTNPRTEFSCILNPSVGCPPFVDCCQASFDLPIRTDAPTGGFTVEVEASDGVGNRSTQRCDFAIGDAEAPELVVRPCGGTVQAGGTFQVRVEATDETQMGSLRAGASADVVTPAQREAPCPPGVTTCAADLAFSVRTGAPLGEFTLDVEAFDTSGNPATKQCTYEVLDPDATPPEVTADPCGGITQPGQTIRLRAEARDDAGLDRLVVSVPAGVGVEPTQEVNCNGLRSCTRSIAVPLRGEFGVNAFDVRIEAVDTDGTAGRTICAYDVVRPPPVTLRKIADRETPVPGHEPATFTGFADWAISGGKVAFSGKFRQDFRDLSGIFVWDGSGIVRVADGNTVIPGTEGPRHFRDYSQLSIDGEEIVFDNRDQLARVVDLYRMRVGGDPVNGAERVLDFPDGELPIFSFFYRDGFVGGWLSPSGTPTNWIYFVRLPAAASAIEVVVDQSDDIPMGSGKFTQFASPASLDVDQGGAIFAFEGFGADGQTGVYVARRGSPVTFVADRDTELPGWQGTFGDFCGVSIDGTEVAFQGQQSSIRQGVYATRGGVLRMIADQRTNVPGGTGTFEEFSCVTGFDDGIVYFRTDEPNGFFANVGGAVTRIVAEGDSLDGGVVTGVLPGTDDRVEGNRAVVFVSGQRGDGFFGGLYLATLETGEP